jgi:hypothetical protein
MPHSSGGIGEGIADSERYLETGGFAAVALFCDEGDYRKVMQFISGY